MTDRCCFNAQKQKMTQRSNDSLKLSQCLMVTSKSLYVSSTKYSLAAHSFKQGSMTCTKISERSSNKANSADTNKSRLSSSKPGNIPLKRIADNGVYNVSRTWRKESSSPNVVEAMRQRPNTTSEGQRPNTTSEGQRPNTTSEGQRPNTKSEGQRPNTTSEGQRPNTTSEGQRPNTTSEGQRCKLRHRDTLGYRPATVSGTCRRVAGIESQIKPRKMDEIRNDGSIGSRHPDKYNSIITLLSKSLMQDNFLAFASTLRLMDKSKRSLMVNLKPENHNNLFFTACRLSRVSFIEYMLSECNPDLELPGLFDDHISPHYATPLWLAASSGNLPLTQLLIRHQAEVNAISSSGSTAVMAACFGGRLDTVFLLVTNGADVHFKNNQGITCLMAAIQSPDIIKLLVRCGVRVNDVDCHGNTALHYASEVGNLQAVQLLVELGANPFVYNHNKCNSFLTAAKSGQEHIVEYLFTVRSLKTSEMINTYVILGAMTMLLNDNYESGIRHWQKAVTLHKFIPAPVYQFKVKKSILTECWDLNELLDTEDELVHITNDTNALNLQALVICEKLYGQQHDCFINVLMYRGAICADNERFLEALRLWTTAYILNLDNLVRQKYDNCKQYNSLELFHSNVIKNVHYIVQVLFQLQEFIVPDNMNNADNSVPECLTRNIFELMINHIEKSVQIFNSQHVTFLMRSCLCVLFVYLHMYPPSRRHPHIGLHLRRLIQLAPRADRNETILHMCLDMHVLDSIDTGQCMKQHWPSNEMLDILLLLGADPRAKDVEGDSILHQAVSLHNQGFVKTSHLIKTLLKRGVHLDQVNHQGQIAFDSLQCADDLKLMLNTLPLKCLAARTVATYKLNYIGEIPRDLYNFVELHMA